MTKIKRKKATMLQHAKKWNQHSCASVYQYVIAIKSARRSFPAALTAVTYVEFSLFQSKPYVLYL